MGLSLRNIGKKIWETVTPQNEEAIRRANASTAAANQRIQSLGNNAKGVLSQQPARQQFIQRNQPTNFSLANATRAALADTLTQPQQLASAPKANLGTWKGSGLVEDFINSPFKIAEGNVRTYKGLADGDLAQVKQGMGKVVTGFIEGPVGLVPIGKVAQVGKGAKLLPKVVAGATQGVKEGAVYGGAYGAGNAASQNASGGDIMKSGVAGAAIGGAAGGLLGGGAPVVIAGAKQGAKAAKVGAKVVADTVDNRVPLLANQVGSVGDAPLPKVFPSDKVTAARVDDAVSSAPKQAKGTVRLYQGTTGGAQTPWYFDNPDQLKQYFGNRSEGVDFRVVDVPEGAAKPSPDRPGVYVVDDTALPTTPQLETTIDPTDPFNNRSFLGKLRGELGGLVDDDAQMIALLRKVEKETGRKGLVDQWYFDTGNIKASNSMANAKLKNSTELQEAFGGLSKKEIAEYDDYAAARAESKNYNGLKTSQDLPELEARVAAGEERYGARFEAHNRYYKQLAQDMYDGGLIDKDKLDEYLAADNYIRIQRDMEDLVGQGTGKSQARSIGTTKATQKRTGSQRDVLSPSEATAKRTQDIQLEISRNNAANNTIDLLKELGIAQQVADTKNKNTISRLVGGKREVYEVPADIKEVIDNVNPYQLGILARIVSTPTRLLRAGATALSAPFTVTNYLRDQASSAIYSKRVIDTHNPVNIFQGLGSAIRDFAGESQHPLWAKFEQFYGNQTIYDDLRNAKNSGQIIREIRKGNSGKWGNMVRSPIRTLEDLNSITEKATRFQNFKGIYEKAIKDGLGEDEAIKRAAVAARQNSVDFQRNSDFTRTINLFIPYFNASTQGSRNVVRSFRDRPIPTSMKTVGFVALPSVAVTLYNYADDDRRKVYESINEFEKETSFIVVGPNPKQRPDGSWEGVYKIPKPQGYRELTDPARDVTEAFVSGEASQDVAGMFKDMLGGLTGPVSIKSTEQFIGGLIPQQVKPSVQAVANRDFYSGNQIVPEFMLDGTDDPSKQAYKGTSGTARIIADQLGVSPIKVEKFFSDTAGSLGRYGLNASDNLLASSGKIPEEQIGGRSIVSDFSRRLFEASGDLLEENKTAGRKYYEREEKLTAGLNANELAADNSLHPDKKNFAGELIYEADSTYNPAARLDVYNRFPKVYELDKKRDQYARDEGKPGNPLFDLPFWQVRKVLEKENLPPGAKDPELSKLHEQDWYNDYYIKKSEYFTKIGESQKQQLAEAKKRGDTEKVNNIQASMDKFNNQTNKYPKTSPELQKIMDTYSALPKGTGERSAWIKANPGQWKMMQDQFRAIDNWQNIARGKRGLDATEGDVGTIAGYGQSSGSGQSRGGSGGSGSSGTTLISPYKYAVYTKGSVPRGKLSISKKGSAKIKTKAPAKPKVTIKKSLV